MNPKDKIHKDWLSIVNLLHEEPLKTLSEIILPEISFQPKFENIFKVFEMPVTSIKVVILGYEPYCTPNDSSGLSFGTNKHSKIPLILKIISNELIKENIKSEFFDINIGNWKTLNHWQKQGIFLFNIALTVETGKAGSHLKYWEDFTKKVINYISIKQPCIWLLWGKKAEKFIPYIKNTFTVYNYNKETIEQIPINPDWNYLLVAPHPATEIYNSGNARFFGCNHFYYTNRILKKLSKSTIDW